MLLAAIFSWSGSAGGAAQEPGTSIPMDRWLVSGPFPTAQGAGATADTLAAATREAQFPQRGLTVAGVEWNLVREDGASRLRLAPDSAGTFLAHGYVRSAVDRTVRLLHSAAGCGTVSIWLNGQRLGEAPGERGLLVRLAAGWNTLLALVSAPDCPPTLGVALRSVAAERDERREEEAASELRVQASRPPGVRRTHPAPWVTVEAEVSPESPGRVGEPGADLTLRVTAWGRSATQAAAPEAEPDDPVDEETAEEATDEEREEGEPEAEGEEAREAPEPGEAPEAGPRPRTPPAEESAEARRRRLLERLAPPPEPPPPAPTAVEVDARAGGARHRTTVQPTAPAVPVTLSFPLDERQLAEAARRGLRVDLRWREGRRRVEMPWPGQSAPGSGGSD